MERARRLQAPLGRRLACPLQLDAMMRFHQVAVFLPLQLITSQQRVLLRERINALQHEVLTCAAMRHAIARPRMVEEVGISGQLKSCQRLCLQMKKHATLVLSAAVFGKRTAVKRIVLVGIKALHGRDDVVSGNRPRGTIDGSEAASGSAVSRLSCK